MNQTLESLDRAVRFGLENGKTNMIVDLEPLALLFEQRDELLQACKRLQAALIEIDQLLDLRDVAEGADKRLLLEFDDASLFRAACRKAVDALAKAEGK